MTSVSTRLAVGLGADLLEFHPTPGQRTCLEAGVLGVGALAMGGLNIGEAALLNATSLVGKIGLWPAGAFGLATYAIEQATHPLWNKLYQVENLPPFARLLAKVAEVGFSRLAALGVLAAVGITFTGWQALALVVANIAGPYILAAGLALAGVALTIAGKLLKFVGSFAEDLVGQVAYLSAVALSLAVTGFGHNSALADPLAAGFARSLITDRANSLATRRMFAESLREQPPAE